MNCFGRENRESIRGIVSEIYGSSGSFSTTTESKFAMLVWYAQFHGTESRSMDELLTEFLGLVPRANKDYVPLLVLSFVERKHYHTI